MTKHVLEVDGYHVAERLLEGVMFQVHVEEFPGDLTITDVTTKPSDKGYLASINVAKFLPEIRKHVQENIDYLKATATSNGQTINDLLDDWEVESKKNAHYSQGTYSRIDLLEEV